MEYEIIIKLKIDPDANYLEVSGNNCDVVQEQIVTALYEIDDVEIIDMDVTQC